jgi:hydroxyacylglutathione hydrolase
MDIWRIPILLDNYTFLLHNPKHNLAAIVDPGEAKPVLQCLEKLGAALTAIFITHHHHDHLGGNLELLRHFPQICVYGSVFDRGRIPAQQVFLQDGDRVKFVDHLGEVLFVPGHTRAHIAYYFPPQAGEDTGELFCGDTLFAGGCGRLKEGTPAQMVDSLTKIRNLPDNTRIWCAHEYTLTNLKFALTVEPDNLELQSRYRDICQARSRQEATIPSLLAVEKQTNPFLRWDSPQIQALINSRDPITTFAYLRRQKDIF